jgi:hypothetical protein
MKLTKFEYSHLADFVRGLSNSQFHAGDRLNVKHLDPGGDALDLQDLGEEPLQKLVNVLPSGKAAKITSPVLKAVRHKVKTALLGIRRPLLDPEHWPKVLRRMHKVSLARSGLRQGPMGQIFVLHDKGMQVSLGGTHIWDERNAGDLVIMGRWHEITAEIGKAGGALQCKSKLSGSANDVNAEFDRMYGSLPGDDPGWSPNDGMPFYVSCSAGPMFRPTNDEKEGEVVLNLPGELVKLAAGAVAGIAGGAIPTGYGLEGTAGAVMGALGAAKDAIDVGRDPARWAKDAISEAVARDKAFDKTILTVTIGITPSDSKYVSTGKTQLGWQEVLDFTLKAIQLRHRG